MRKLFRWILRGVVAVLALVLAYVVASVAYTHAHEQDVAAQAAPAGGRFANAGGVTVYSQAHGDLHAGTPVLLVHGTAAWSGTWFNLVPALVQAGHPVIAVDLPPFGYSDKATTLDFTRPAQAERLRATLDAWGVRRVIVVGHSFGGGPALEFALRAPERVERLVLVDAALGLQASPPDPSSLACRMLATPALRNPLISATAANPLWSGTLLRSFVARKAAVTPERLQAYRAPASLRGASAALAAWSNHFACESEHGASTDPTRLRTLQPPLFLLWGREDTITPLAQAEFLATLVPATRLRVIDGVGHIPHIEAPDAFPPALLDTLAAP